MMSAEMSAFPGFSSVPANPVARGCIEMGRSGTLMFKLKRAIAFFLLALALCSGMAARGGDAPPPEPQVRAAFLLNFPKYVEWPAASFASPTSPIQIAVLGAENVADDLAAMSDGKLFEGHPIKLLRNPTLAECLNCHILFIGSGEARKTTDIVGQLKLANVLTVGESEQFIDQGGMINLALRDRRIVLEVNLDATRRTELKISSKLMALAKVKGGKK
jgi:hypothetical protein